MSVPGMVMLAQVQETQPSPADQGSILNLELLNDAVFIAVQQVVNY